MKCDIQRLLDLHDSIDFLIHTGPYSMEFADDVPLSLIQAWVDLDQARRALEEQIAAARLLITPVSS